MDPPDLPVCPNGAAVRAGARKHSVIAKIVSITCEKRFKTIPPNIGGSQVQSASSLISYARSFRKSNRRKKPDAGRCVYQIPLPCPGPARISAGASSPRWLLLSDSLHRQRFNHLRLLRHEHFKVFRQAKIIGTHLRYPQLPDDQCSIVPDANELLIFAHVLGVIE